jgi:AcrR family transcriptional regulator
MSALPPPPWRTPARPRPARRSLHQDQIVEVALRIVRAEGIDSVSMRRIAQELGTGPSSLYAHVANKDELLELMIARISADIRVEPPDPRRWKEQVKTYARTAYQAFAAHNDLARAALARIPLDPESLRVSEAMLAAMLAGGVPPQIAAWAIDRIFLYLVADAFEGSIYGAQLKQSGESVERFHQRVFGQLRGYLAGLPKDRFPATSAHAEELTSGDGDERFEFGLGLLVDGLDRYRPVELTTPRRGRESRSLRRRRGTRRTGRNHD